MRGRATSAAHKQGRGASALSAHPVRRSDARLELHEQRRTITGQSPHERRIRGGSGIMPSRPRDHVQHERQQLDPACRQRISGGASSSIAPDDARLGERLEAGRQDVRRDAFLRVGELGERPLAREQQIAHDEEAPRVAEQLEGEVDGAARASIGSLHESLAKMDQG